MWANWITFIVGIWLFLSGLIPSLQGEANMIIAGAVAIVFGFIAVKTWQGVINGILGVWIFLSGLWFMIEAPANYLIVGAVMAILGIWGAIPHTGSQTVSHTTA